MPQVCQCCVLLSTQSVEVIEHKHIGRRIEPLDDTPTCGFRWGEGADAALIRTGRYLPQRDTR